MPVYKRPDSPYWQVRFELAGFKVRKSSGSEDKHTAEEFEESLRRDLWRQIKLGERRHTWDEAIAKCKSEDSYQKSWDRTEDAINWLSKHLKGELLTDITYDAILKLRELRAADGVALGTINRDFCVLRSILRRCVDPWKMLDKAPKVPMYRLPKVEPHWLTREQVIDLLGRFPVHTADMTIFSLATGLRRSNVTGMKWAWIDMRRATAYIPGDKSKGREAITIALNADALAVLQRWKARHEKFRESWSARAHQYVFVYRGFAPIKQLTTKMWRRVCIEAGMEGVTFHCMRHSWASWHVQAGTPLKMVQEMGGWASLEMVMRYAHLNPGHLSQYADRTLLRTETVTVPEQQTKTDVSPCIGGAEGDRTLDLRIANTALRRKA